MLVNILKEFTSLSILHDNSLRKPKYLLLSNLSSYQLFPKDNKPKHKRYIEKSILKIVLYLE